MTNVLLSDALEYADRGFSVIPVGKQKKPLIKWEKYQKEKADEKEIKEWFSKWSDSNIGIVTGAISNLAVIDVDTEEGKEAIQEFIPDSIPIPTVSTPHGGQHLYFTCPDNRLSNNTRIIAGCDLRANGGYIIAPPSVNGNGKGYAWLKGLSLDEVEIPTLPDAYVSFLKKALNNNIYNYNSFSYKENVTKESYNSLHELHSVTKMFTQGRRDNDLFHVSNCLVKGGMPTNEIYNILFLLANSCNPPFDLKELPAKIQSAIKRSERRERNIMQEVRDWVLLQDGYFSVTTMYHELQAVTKEEKTAIRVALLRLKDGQVLEKHTNESGKYRKIENDCNVIDFKSALDTEFEIEYPFGIENFVKTLPKNIIVVAGAPNAGKTAFLLNVAEMNQSKHDVNYFSSEMGEIELKDRLSKFDKPLDSWHFTAFERSENFADVIKPDSINIIDFLEMHEDFWKVGLFIKQIYDKLNKGIALIALQKNPGVNYGLGGARSIEKARLYLTLDNHRIKIEKAKNWVNSSVNPNGLEAEYKLVNGCDFKITKAWARTTQ